MIIRSWPSFFRTLRECLPATPPSVTLISDEGGDPFRILVSTLLSLRTKDRVTLTTSRRLLEKAASPEDMADLDEDEIARTIKPVGFYRTKAASLRRIAHILIERYGGMVPSSEADLLELPGVGRKTANLVRGLGFGIPAICVDTHVHRISNRLGWVSTTDPKSTETALTTIVPPEHWIELNTVFVLFGQAICTPRSPRCSCCPISVHCPRIGVDRFR